MVVIGKGAGANTWSISVIRGKIIFQLIYQEAIKIPWDNSSGAVGDIDLKAKMCVTIGTDLSSVGVIGKIKLYAGV